MNKITNFLHHNNINIKYHNQNIINQLLFDLKSDSKNQLSSGGFTILEVLVALVIIGILSAIVGPSWFSFVNRQQINKVNDEILAALQTAQRKAKKTKLPYSVSLTTDTKNGKKVAQIAIHPNDSEPDQYWEILGKEVGVGTENIILGSNITDENKSTKTISYANKYNKTKPQAITFNQIGGLSESEINDGIKIVVAIPKAGKSTQASDVKRCIIVQTILGGMRTAKDTDCE
ncbi:pilus assembly FimT family protein [Mastigocoleus testarum]|uniref:Prepilin-type N-terminal cleavage/methylation domain-containing protein n=1 Tax=Mastigocoleus testarum BC008 TaxID=371196 RepID=A0A0V7ZIC4_9CYAN|nr:type II secretion system protein [Mastigocoleus testarum]KST64309.1 hypothetical protein BC008_16870 [Mastigocoleus testarum BC008]KST64362.1 hypothetical protein BC008_17155 [Mastigocoleus testarum BC008]